MTTLHEGKTSSKKSLIFKISLIVAFSLTTAGGWMAWLGVEVLFQHNVTTLNSKDFFLQLPTGTTFEGVIRLLDANHLLADTGTFRKAAIWKDYPKKIKPGRYLLKNGMNNRELVNLLQSGRQEPVKVVFNTIRTKAELAGRIGRQIEADSASVLSLLNDRGFLDQFGLTPLTAFVLFIPNTYEFYWNTSAEQFIRRMDAERKKFWSEERLAKAERTGLGINGTVILASIVEKETNRNEEKAVIAGVYLNRLQKGWPLQADPTLIFALNDFTIKRVLNRHKEIDSPYNTYLHTGLPPGPICLPSVASLEAVLNPSHHHYMYFCAKEDLSGAHNFAVTLAEHNRNAARYQAALAKLNIR